MMNTKSVAMLMMVMIVVMGMENIWVHANRHLCDLSGRCGRDPSSSPSQDDNSFDFDLFSDFLSSNFHHHTPKSPSPSPSQDDSSSDSYPPSSEFHHHTPKSLSPSPSQDDSSYESEPPSLDEDGNRFFCGFGFALNSCSYLGSDPKYVKKFISCMEDYSNACMKVIKNSNL